MSNVIAGLVALILFLVFLGFYVYRVPTLPLWIIIGVTVVLFVSDLILTWRSGEHNTYG